MSCLDDLNLVGLRDDCGVDILTASTGYYVNDLNIPGLLEVVASAKDKSQTDAQAAIINQIDISKRLTVDLLRSNTGDRRFVHACENSFCTRKCHKGTRAQRFFENF